MGYPRPVAFMLGSVLCLTLANPGGVLHALSGATATAQVTPSGDGIELEFTEVDGTVSKETIPLYKAGTIRYFSAGIGLEERSAKYPAFPLKLIFVVGPKAYLSQVSVTIADTEGKVRLQVPREQVTGPWLFVDLPPGTYEITAEGPGKAQVKERVTISAKEGKTVYMRWEGETS